MDRPIPVTIAAGQLGLGGGERQLYLVLRELDRRAFRPAVVTFNPGRGDHWEQPIRELGVPLEAVAQSQNKAARLAAFVGLLRATAPAILHSWDLPLNGAVALCSRIAGIGGRVGGLRRNLFKPGRRRGWQRWAGTTGLERFVVNSSRGRDDLTRCGVARERIDVVPNAVEPPTAELDASARAAVRRAWGVERDDEVVIANISNLIAVKNHALLLEATAELIARGRAVRAVIFGDGPLRDELAARCAAAELRGKVTWAGRDAQAPRLIAAADLFCFTSRSEGCPNVLLEAGAARCALVTTDVGGARDIVRDEETGSIVPSDDRAALVAALDRLVLDPGLRARMGAAARERVLSEFTPMRTARALEAVYDSVLAGR